MLSRDENDLLTRVGPGTPCGEMLRRYWWPIGFSELVAEKQSPTKVRLLSEDFVLFRNGAGHLGLLELHCSHRGTSLEFGRVEDQGIRCCYHGWLYDTAGRCLEQPAEPADSTFKDRIRHPAYKVREIAGFIFAYWVRILRRSCPVTIYSCKRMANGSSAPAPNTATGYSARKIPWTRRIWSRFMLPNTRRWR